MAIDANQFILQGFGGGSDPAASLSNLSNRLYARNMQQQRLDIARQAKRSQAGNFLSQYLDPKDYLTGTAYDPVINKGLQQALEQGASLAEQGADIPQLMMALSPYTRRITDYSAKAKAINKQADDAIKTMRESGYMGYDYAKLKDEALRAAFHNYDPTTGADIGLRNIDEVDPSQNYIMKTLQDHPERVTTAEALDQFVKAYPQAKNSTDATTYTPTGTMTRNKINMIGQGYLVPEVDANGVVTGLVPAYEHANDGGAPITHDFIQPDGTSVNAPVRLLDEGYFNEAVSHKGIGDWLRGQVAQHLREYKDKTGQQIDMNSAQAHNVARAILYDELKRRSPGSIQFQEVLDKPSAAQIQLRTFGDKRQQAYDYEMGRQQARKDLGLPATGAAQSDKPLNAVETIHQIFNNNEDYLKGDIVNKEGHDVIDVTPFFKNATLKFGRGVTGTYDGVYYDPKRRTMMMEDQNGDITEQGEKGLKDFSKKIAAANNINVGAVDPSFRNAGYNEKEGVYKKVSAAPGVTARYAEREAQHQQRINKGLDDLITNGKSADLEGLKFPEGKIKKVGTPWWGGKYYIDYTDNKGKDQTKKFTTRQEMEKFLSPTAQNEEQAPTESTNLDKKEEEVLKKHGL